MYAAMDENLNPNNQLEDEPDLSKVKEDDNDAPSRIIFLLDHLF